MTQEERIIEYLNDWGSITTYEAFNDLGITRLASRICDLKKKGYDFTIQRTSKLNRYGEKITFNRYSLKEEQR